MTVLMLEYPIALTLLLTDAKSGADGLLVLNYTGFHPFTSFTEIGQTFLFRMTQKPRKGNFRELKSRTFQSGWGAGARTWPRAPLGNIAKRHDLECDGAKFKDFNPALVTKIVHFSFHQFKKVVLMQAIVWLG